jgi:hypothetical protein
MASKNFFMFFRPIGLQIGLNSYIISMKKLLFIILLALISPACMIDSEYEPYYSYEYGYCDTDQVHQMDAYIPSDWYVEYCTDYYDAYCCLTLYDDYEYTCESEICYYYDTCGWESTFEDCYQYY